MPYLKLISQACAALIVLVIDDSASMDEHLHGTQDAKFRWVARYIGIIFKLLLSRSTANSGGVVSVKPRYHVCVITYGSSPRIWGPGRMNIEQTITKFTADGSTLDLGGNLGGTDARAAMEMAYDQLSAAVQEDQFRNSFPPMLFHLTDGESQTDAEPVVDRIKQLSTTDGQVLVVNGYIGTQTSLAYNGPEDFPGYVDIAEAGPGQDNERLFRMSSETPDSVHRNLVDSGTFPTLRTGTRLFYDIRTREMLKQVIQVVGSGESCPAR